MVDYTTKDSAGGGNIALWIIGGIFLLFVLVAIFGGGSPADDAALLDEAAPAVTEAAPAITE